MKYCRSKDARQTSLFLLACWFFIAAYVAISSFELLFYGLPGILAAGFICLLFGFLLWDAVVNAVWYHRKFAVDTTGIQTAYFHEQPLQIDWDSISEIGICVVHHSTKLPAEMVIRCVVGKECSGPSAGYGPWAYLRYSKKNHRRIILLDYTEALAQEIETVCPIQLRDYRHLSNQ